MLYYYFNVNILLGIHKYEYIKNNTIFPKIINVRQNSTNILISPLVNKNKSKILHFGQHFRNDF